ncbi:MAG: glycerol-3-phosphate O-acyltransferase, partial [Bradymonadia bacterium]
MTEPEHPDRPDASEMVQRPNGLFRWVGRWMFDRVPVDHDAASRVRTQAEQGQVIYVMRTRSKLDYLFFNYFFLKVGLPLARFANGVNVDFYRSLKLWLQGLWRRWSDRDETVPADRLLKSVRAGESALVFMKRRVINEERQASPGLFEALVAEQRNQARPLLLLPQLISWPRKPASKRSGFFDGLFGNQDTPGRLRKIIFFFRHRKLASVRLGEPIDLKAVLAEHEGWSDARVARKVRRVLFIHLAHEAMAVRGPKMKPPSMIRREILERRKNRTALEKLGQEVGLDPLKTQEKARGYLKEIAARTSFEFMHVCGWFLDWVFNRVFKGVEVDAAGMRRIKDAARSSRSAPLILVPSHKSHMDYLVISWVFYRNEFVPPHIAAGSNLSFFPLGSVLRRAGAFFLRRSFTGLPVYSLVFRFYLWKLVREGYPLEFFMEGGRSRTGKLLPPKLGMLRMLLDGIREGEYSDLQFVPINLSYEKVLETSSYSRELTGGAKQSENLGQVVKARRVLSSRYGRVYVNFEEPVRLSDWLKSREVDLVTADEPTTRDVTRRLAYHLMRRIHEATTVSPSALVGAVLLSHDRRGMSGVKLREVVGFLIDMLQRRGARLSHALTHHLEASAADIEAAAAQSGARGHQARGAAVGPLLEEALQLLKKLVETTERGGRTIYSVPEKSRIELDYYRNIILSILAPECLVATVLHSHGGPQVLERLSQATRRLSYWFRLEFIYRTDASFDVNLADTLEGLIAEGILARDDTGRISAQAPKVVGFLSAMLRHLVEGYWVAADALRGLAESPMDRKAWLDHAREHGERLYLEDYLSRPEAASTAILGNALELFRSEDLVVRRDTSSGRKPQWMYTLADNENLEAVAFRRDDIEVFRTRQAIPVLRLPSVSGVDGPDDSLLLDAP